MAGSESPRFGEARILYCHATRVTPDIRGEDVTTVMLDMGDGVTVICALSYASPVEHDRFNETFMFILEPAMAVTVILTCMVVTKETIDPGPSPASSTCTS